MLWSAALFFYVYYTPAQPDCQRLPAAAKNAENAKPSENSNLIHPFYTPSGPEGVFAFGVPFTPPPPVPPAGG